MWAPKSSADISNTKDVLVHAANECPYISHFLSNATYQVLVVSQRSKNVKVDNSWKVIN